MSAIHEVITVPLEHGAELKVPVRMLVRTFLSNLVAETGQEKLEELRSVRPSIGAAGMHGIYAGIARGVGAVDCALEVLDQAPAKMTWGDAVKWAESIGGTLPTRREAALLFGNVPDLFEHAWYWTSEQYAGADGYAWCQSFDGGIQNYGHESSQLLARAVRRFPLDSVIQ